MGSHPCPFLLSFSLSLLLLLLPLMYVQLPWLHTATSTSHIAHELLHHPSLPSRSCNSPAPNPCVFLIFTPSSRSCLNTQTPWSVLSQPGHFPESQKLVHCLHLSCSISQVFCLYLCHIYLSINHTCWVLTPGRRKPCFRSIRVGKKRSLDKRLNSQCH